ncbi:phosphotransferase [Idiomarina sp. PL1-037]|uniref:phosphotransferase n=1 Tax=Idiomarina sp. PL1-037 TaxID=3095365 RepID=UPI002ACC135F|nr:phosphotransferase [Idiomarina sp. PL1-037]WQC52766.1 phosphotransferase [Idiomarina sp. PL1-037]
MIRRPREIQELASGQSNQTLWLRTKTEDYVLKRWRYEQVFAVDRELEVSIQKELAQQTLAPDVFDYDVEQGWLLQPYYQAPSLQQMTLSPLSKATVLAETLSKIHNTRVDIPAWSMTERVEHYLQQLRSVNSAVAGQMSQKLAPMQPLLEDWLSYPVLCHNDLSMNHILMTEPVRVIDWEYAGIGHPLFDIASAIVVNELSDDVAVRLIAEYERVAHYQIDRQRLAQWCEFVEWLNKVWQHLFRHFS